MTGLSDQQLLLACLRLASGRDAALPAGLSLDDWQAMVQLAQTHEVAPLLSQRLKAPVPAPVTAALRTAYLRSAARNALIYRDIGAMLAALREAGVPTIVLKGIHLAQFVYGNIALRPMYDVDILVGRDDLQRADEALRALGYERPETFRFDLAIDQHWPTLLRPGAVPVEVHWTIMPPAGSVQVDVPGLWQRAQPSVFAGQPALVLSPEDLLLYVSLHASVHHKFNVGLRPLCDIAEVLRFYRDTLDWEQVVSRARAWRADRSLYLTFRVIAHLLGERAPEPVMQQLEPPVFDSGLLAAASDKIFGDDAVLSTEYMLFWRPAADLSRLALLWRSLFPPREVMARLYPRAGQGGRGLLYYPARWKDLLLRYGRTTWARLKRDRGVAAQIERDTILRDRDAALRDWLTSA